MRKNTDKSEGAKSQETWTTPRLFIVLGCYRVIVPGCCLHACSCVTRASQDEDHGLPLIQERRCRITGGRSLLRCSPPRSWTHGGPAMAESREPTATLTRWGLASPFNHHTVVHWPGSQLRQKRLKLNSIQLPVNNCHLNVNFFIFLTTHLEAVRDLKAISLILRWIFWEMCVHSAIYFCQHSCSTLN